MSSIVYGGLDVHQESISAYLLCSDTGEVVTDEVANERQALHRAVQRWSRLGELRLCYEASSAGFVVRRWMEGWGVPCDVIAPSLIPRAPGERIKTDRRDARNLALCYRGGLLQPVRVPSEAEETTRAVVRLRDAMTRDMTRAKNRVRKYLALLGWPYPGPGRWGPAHRAWIDHLPLNADQRLVVQSHLDALDDLTRRRAEVDARIAQLAQSPAYAPQVQRLMCLRGIDLYSAMVLACEIGDVRRFAAAPPMMSYFGLVPGEYSSGERQKRGHITKAGNARARWILIQAAWNQTSQPGSGAAVQQRRKGQPAAVVAIARRAERRLHRRFWHLARRKDRKTAAVAVARELAGFVWAILQAPAA